MNIRMILSTCKEDSMDFQCKCKHRDFGNLKKQKQKVCLEVSVKSNGIDNYNVVLAVSSIIIDV